MLNIECQVACMPLCIVLWQLQVHIIIIIILSRPRLRSDADITKQNIVISSEVFPNFLFLLVSLVSFFPSPCSFQFLQYCYPRSSV